MTKGNSTTRCWYSSIDQGKRPKNEDTFFHGHITVKVPSLGSCCGPDDMVNVGSGSSSTENAVSCSSASCESASCSGSGITNMQDLLIAGCFDGHGGDFVSKHLAENMTSRICSLLQGRDVNSTTAVAQALTSAFTSIDHELKVSKQAHMMGSTAVVALVTDTMIHISSCGDSRAIICRGIDAAQPVQDHNPSREDEQARILRHGGQVLQRNGARVMGALAMSRAIGDHALRPYGVTADPDVAHHDRCDDDQYLVIASDGLWNVMTNKDVACVIQLFLSELSAVGLKRKQINALLPKLLTKVALRRGSTDNITVILLDISSSSSYPDQHKQQVAGLSMLPTGLTPTVPGLMAQQQQGATCSSSSSRLSGAVAATESAAAAVDKDALGQLALQRIQGVMKIVSSTKWNSNEFAAMYLDYEKTGKSGSYLDHHSASKPLQPASEFLVLEQPSVAAAVGAKGSPTSSAVAVAVPQQGFGSCSPPVAIGHQHNGMIGSCIQQQQQQGGGRLWSSSSAPPALCQECQSSSSVSRCKCVKRNLSSDQQCCSGSSDTCTAHAAFESPFAAVQAEASIPRHKSASAKFPPSCNSSALQTPFRLVNCSDSNGTADSSTISVKQPAVSGTKRRLIPRLLSAEECSMFVGDVPPLKLRRLSTSADCGCQVIGVGIDQGCMGFAVKADAASVCA